MAARIKKHLQRFPYLSKTKKSAYRKAEANYMKTSGKILANNLKHINDEKESGLLDFNMDYNND